MKKHFSVFSAAVMLLFYICRFSLPDTKNITYAPLGTSSCSYLIPLDSRPVCTTQPQSLAHLAGINLILPPKEFLDNYRQPGDTEKLYSWLQNTLATGKKQEFLLSSDMLLSGGLLASRQQSPTLQEQQKFFSLLQHTSTAAADVKVFSLIPRLLVSDELLPDRWYKYRLLRYSQLYHQSLVTGDFRTAQAMYAYQQKIPQDILNKYIKLFQSSTDFNQQLLQHSNFQTEVIIGQDDGHLWGLPSLAAQKLEQQLIRLTRTGAPYAHITYGADEIASTLIARSYLQKHQLCPRFYIQYAHPSLPNLHMPYMAASIEAVLQEKLQLTGAVSVASPQAADIILFVSCGHDNYLPGNQEANALKELLTSGANVALIDLTANFEQKELLLPIALEQKAPLNRLIAYGGWNTFSNSAGTTLAQAAIFWGRKKELQTPAQLLSLHAENLRLLTEQLLDNYFYQKEYHAELKRQLLCRSIEPTDLNTRDKAVAEAFIRQFLQQKARFLLHSNLGLTPFYRAEDKEYYLQGFQPQVSLPWNRIFEIDLQLRDFRIGVKNK